MKKELFTGWLILVLTMLFAVELHANETISQKDPQKLVDGLSQFVVNSMNEQRAEFEGNSAKVVEFANQHVLPYVDTEKMARYALGKNWRSASEIQQKAFTQAFTENLIRSYSQSLLNLKIDKVDVSNAVIEKPGRASVSSRIYQQEGKPAEILYRLFESKEGHWYLYDVVIENVSMLLSYRNVYGSAVASDGLDKVIADLQQKNAEASEAPKAE